MQSRRCTSGDDQAMKCPLLRCATLVNRRRHKQPLSSYVLGHERQQVLDSLKFAPKAPFKTFPTIAPVTSQHNSGRSRCTDELVLKLICSHSVHPWFANSLLFRPTVRKRTGFTITDSVAVRTKIHEHRQTRARDGRHHRSR